MPNPETTCKISKSSLHRHRHQHYTSNRKDSPHSRSPTPELCSHKDHHVCMLTDTFPIPVGIWMPHKHLYVPQVGIPPTCMDFHALTRMHKRLYKPPNG